MGTKIPDMTVASALTGAEQLECVQGGSTRRTTAQEIADLGGGAALRFLKAVPVITGLTIGTAADLFSVTIPAGMLEYDSENDLNPTLVIEGDMVLTSGPTQAIITLSCNDDSSDVGASGLIKGDEVYPFSTSVMLHFKATVQHKAAGESVISMVVDCRKHSSALAGTSQSDAVVAVLSDANTGDPTAELVYNIRGHISTGTPSVSLYNMTAYVLGPA